MPPLMRVFLAVPCGEQLPTEVTTALDAWRAGPGGELPLRWTHPKTWHLTLQEHADFIAIPGEKGVRYTPVALTNRTPHRPEALDFIDFLQSEEARRIFEEHGWY